MGPRVLTRIITGAVRQGVLKSADITVEFASGAILAVAGENLTLRVEVASVPEMISFSKESVKLAHRIFTAELIAFFNRVNFADDVNDVVLHDIAFTWDVTFTCWWP